MCQDDGWSQKKEFDGRETGRTGEDGLKSRMSFWRRMRRVQWFSVNFIRTDPMGVMGRTPFSTQ